MVKNIQLKLNEEMFYKLLLDKQRREFNLKIKITWEDYIWMIFGFSKYIK
jgi:hypothetical protein